MTQEQIEIERKNHPVWTAVNELIMRTIPPLLVAVTIGVSSAAWSVYSSVSKLTDATARNEKEIAELRAKLNAVEKNSFTQDQLLGLLKRIEQQLQIVLLQSGVKTQIKITP